MLSFLLPASDSLVLTLRAPVEKVTLQMLPLCYGMHIKHFPLHQITSIGLVRDLFSHSNPRFPSTNSGAHSSGFYVRTSTSELTLGPFHGRPACQTIALGRGVCGTAAAEKRIVNVHNVDKWPGHIACDTASESELVVPILVGEHVVAIIDVDCTAIGGFDKDDEIGLGMLAEVLGGACDWAWDGGKT